MKHNDFRTAFLLAFLYVLLGTYELLWSGKISYSIRSIEILNRIHFDLFTIFPAHIFGSFFWWILGGGKHDNIVFALFGQCISLLFYFVLFLVLIKLYKTLKTKFSHS